MDPDDPLRYQVFASINSAADLGAVGLFAALLPLVYITTLRTSIRTPTASPRVDLMSRATFRKATQVSRHSAWNGVEQ